MPKQPMLSTAPARRSSTPGGGPDPVPLAAPNAGAFPMNTRSSRRRTGSLPTASRAGLRARTPTGPLALEPLESICSVFPWAPSSQEMEPPGNPVQLKHGGCGRRGWRKLHRGVDQSGVILVHTLTEATGDDATTALDLLNAVDGPLVRVTAEAAYDTVAVYETATARGATVIIPPAKTANISGHGPRSPARDSDGHVGEAARPAPLEEGVRVPSSGPGGEHVLPLQVPHRRWPSRPESSWAGE